jgi:hypothetical protein
MLITLSVRHFSEISLKQTARGRATEESMKKDSGVAGVQELQNAEERAGRRRQIRSTAFSQAPTEKNLQGLTTRKFADPCCNS